MADVTDLDPDRHDKIEQVDLQLEMQRSYLDYAMSVIVGRALPDVRDGLKPVHRRVIYAMYDGGYRPDRAFSKCTRIIGDVMGQFHPHGDSSVYDALVRLVQPWSLRYPLALGQGNFGSPGNDGAAAHRYTETKMAPLAMEMVRDIDEDTVDLQDNYDGRTQEPTVLPARFPNLLVNGSVGIAVGMATNIPPHNLREVAEAALWALEHPTAPRDELLEALIQRVKGPDFPTGAQILGVKGIQDAYRTGRGSITMRAVVNVEELQGRTEPRRHRAAVPGQPRQPGDQDRRPRQGGQARRHRRHPRRELGPHRPAPGDRAEARRRREGRAQQPVQAHAAAGELRRQHARDRRRRAAHPRARRVHHALDRSPDRGHRPAHHVPPREGRGRRPHPARLRQGARRARRGHRAHPPLARRRRGAHRADQAAEDRRAAGRRDPRAAAAPPRRARAPEDPGSPRRARARDRRLPGDPQERGAPARRSSSRSSPRSSPSTATTVAPRSCSGTAAT